MNKVEFQEKILKIQELIGEGRFQEAVSTADTLNLDLLDQPRQLREIARAYEKCRRYEDAEILLLQARESAPRSRGILFHLCNVAIKAGNLENAEDYYEDFCNLAPRDTQRYVLQYRLSAAKNRPDEELIEILETIRRDEPNDHWLYILAQYYAKNDQKDKAVEVCNEIDLWFDSGRYVESARELRAWLNGEDPDAFVVKENRQKAEAEPEAAPEAEPETAGEDDTAAAEEASQEIAAAPDGGEVLESPEEDTDEEIAEEGTDEGSAEEAGDLTDAEAAGADIDMAAGDLTDAETAGDAEPEASAEEEEIPGGIPVSPEAEESTADAGSPEETPTGLTAHDFPDFKLPEDILKDLEDAGPVKQETAEPENLLDGNEVISLDKLTKEAAAREKDKKPAYEVKIPEAWKKTMAEREERERKAALKAAREKEAAEKAAAAAAAIREAEGDDAVLFEEEAENGSDIPRGDLSAGKYYADEVSIEDESASGEDPETGYEETAEVFTDEYPEGSAEEEPEAFAAEAREGSAEEEIEAFTADSPEAFAEEEAEEPVRNAPSDLPYDEDEDSDEDAEVIPDEDPEEEPEDASAEENSVPFWEKYFAGSSEEAAEEEDDRAGKSWWNHGRGTGAFREDQDSGADWAGYREESLELAGEAAGEDLFDEPSETPETFFVREFGNLPVDPEVTSDTWHFIIYADNDTYAEECARDRMREIAAINPGHDLQKAKLKAVKIGKTSIVSALDHFLGKMTVIENASLLSDEQLKEFARVLERDDRSLLIALADTREGVEEMFRRVPALSESFTAVFDGKHYTAEELLDLAERYLYEKEARLTPSAMKVVLEKAEALVKEQPGNLPRIMLRFVDQALEKSERGGLFGFGAGKIGSDGILNVDAKHFRGIE